MLATLEAGAAVRRDELLQPRRRTPPACGPSPTASCCGWGRENWETLEDIGLRPAYMIARPDRRRHERPAPPHGRVGHPRPRRDPRPRRPPRRPHRTNGTTSAASCSAGESLVREPEASSAGTPPTWIHVHRSASPSLGRLRLTAIGRHVPVLRSTLRTHGKLLRPPAGPPSRTDTRRLHRAARCRRSGPVWCRFYAPARGRRTCRGPGDRQLVKRNDGRVAGEFHLDDDRHRHVVVAVFDAGRDRPQARSPGS